MRFCDVCENLLKFKQIESELKYSCDICLKNYDLNPEDTKIKTIRVNIADNVYKKNKNLIELFKHDNLLKLIKRNCSNCNHKIMKQCILGNNLDFIYICVKCNFVEI